jgi:hypothetical protein
MPDTRRLALTWGIDYLRGTATATGPEFGPRRLVGFFKVQ